MWYNTSANEREKRGNQMKKTNALSKLVIIMTAALVLIGILGGCIQPTPSAPTAYTAAAEVVEINADSDSVFFETTDGEIFEWGGIESWSVGDCAILTFSNENTASPLDDVIISILARTN